MAPPVHLYGADLAHVVREEDGRSALRDELREH